MFAASVPERRAQWPLWGGTAHLVVRERRPGDLELARATVDAVLDEVERACSRFRPDSEISSLAADDGRRRVVSALLADLLAGALGAAAATGGAVDPTLGLAMIAAGYDTAFARVAPSAPSAGVPTLRRPASWRDIELGVDPATAAATVRTPPGVLLDLGATAKAMAADRAAALAHQLTGCPVMVSLCGDLAVAGTSAGQPWLVEVLERPDDVGGPLVHVHDGAVATSSTTARRWVSAGRRMHHLLDPATALPARAPWRTVTVAAATCLAANTAATAAIVKGDEGAGWLRASGLPARLVAADGRVHTVNDWPADQLERAS